MTEHHEIAGGYGPEEHVRVQLDVHPEHDGDDHDHGHGSLGLYLTVFVALCVLTGASFFTYSRYWPFSDPVAWAFMMAVSCTKAMLVIMFFMHLLWEANWKWVLTIPASFMSVFLMLMLVPDIGWRQDNGYAQYSRERLLYAAERRDAEADKAKAAEGEHSHTH
jgi:cytochrome c oxidase subunit IV